MENIFKIIYRCLSESNLDKKLEYSKISAEKIKSGNVSFFSESFVKNLSPGRPVKPELIEPRHLPKRNLLNKEGKAAMIHSFAHIEFNAINLAWDLIYRFQDMPEEFYRDWSNVAYEETIHFELLNKKLFSLGCSYGDFPAHDGLWKIAEDTAHDILLRLAVVPRIMEARGLDVTPDIINRFKQIKDHETVSILETILEDEIGHVNYGSKWFKYVCDIRGINSETYFKKVLENYLPNSNVKKLNVDARIKAGFTELELNYYKQK